MTDTPHTDRLMAEIRGKLDAISNSAEQSRAFKSADDAYATWLERHLETGYVVHRKTAAAKTATIHKASCERVAASDEAELFKGPRVGCPTKPVALAIALSKKWKVADDCPVCVAAE